MSGFMTALQSVPSSRRQTCCLALAVMAVAACTPGSAVAAIGGKIQPSAAPKPGKAPSLTAHAQGFSPTAAPSFVPDELLVRFKSGASAQRREAVRQSHDARFERHLAVDGLQLVRLSPGKSERLAAAEFEQDPEVLYAEPNYYFHLTATPNDPRFGDLWGLHNTGQAVDGAPAGLPDADIDAPDAWDVTTGSSGVTVAVIDSGVAYDHPDLAPNMWVNQGESGGGREANGLDDDADGFVDDWRGWDWVQDDNDPRDFNGHGTHVAGTIGARGNDGSGVAGINWQTRLMSLRVLDASGSGSTADLVSAYAYAGANGARVANVSIGGGAFSQAALDAINGAPNTLFVVAAGNGGSDGIGDNNDVSPVYPCNYNAANLVCVAAANSSDNLASFSNYGQTSVDLAAPGVDILSTQPAYGAPTLSEGFESDIAQTWTTGGVNNSWARTNAASKSGSSSLADSPGANYLNNSNSYVRSPSINLSGRSGCRLEYQLRLDVERGFDFFYVEASTNGTTWTTVDGYSGSTAFLFLPAESDFSAFDGQASVFLRFRLESDATVTDDGAYVDDVAVRCLSSTFTSSNFAFFNGTSMASPHAAGVAALVLANTPNASTAQIRQRLLAGVDPKPALAGKTVTGGRLNALGAIGAGSQAPDVTTLPATAITESGATLNGTIDPNGTATSYHYELGTSAGNYSLSTPDTSAGSGNSPVQVPVAVTGRTPSTTYHYRLVAIRSGQAVAAGQDMTFTTPASSGGAPVATTLPATSITDATATLNGRINPNGVETSFRFELGLTAGDYPVVGPVASVGAGTSDVPVGAAFTGGTPNTTYHYRVVALRGGQVVAAGQDAAFTTTSAPAQAPGVTTGAASDVTASGATLNGTIDPNGTATSYRFEYGLTTAYGQSTPTTSAGAGDSAVAASASVTGLQPEKAYHYRLVALRSGVSAGAGQDQTFTTESQTGGGTIIGGAPIAWEQLLLDRGGRWFEYDDDDDDSCYQYVFQRISGGYLTGGRSYYPMINGHCSGIGSGYPSSGFVWSVDDDELTIRFNAGSVETIDLADYTTADTLSIGRTALGASEWLGCDAQNLPVLLLPCFSSPSFKTLTVSANTASVTSRPSGLTCPGRCAAQFITGSQVTLTANPPSGQTFSAWTGVCAGQGNVCSLTMNSDLQTAPVYTTPSGGVLGGGSTSNPPTGGTQNGGAAPAPQPPRLAAWVSAITSIAAAGKARGGKARIRVRCRALTGSSPCEGTVSLGRRYGKASFKVGPGVRTITVTLTRIARSQLARRRRLPVTVTVKLRQGDGSSDTSTASLVLRS